MLAVGRMHLAEFAPNPQHFYLLRLVDPPDEPPVFPDHHVLVSRGPFTFEDDRALMELCWHFGRHMRDQGETCWINNVASIAAFQSAPGYSVYAASKSFVRFFSETLAHELKGTGVFVSCLCPGATYTEFMEKAKMEVTEAGHASFMSAEAVARIGIAGLLRGEPTVVPGAVNKLAAFLPRFTPSRLSLKLAGMAMRRSVRSID